jgi:hypothetical protein
VATKQPSRCGKRCKHGMSLQVIVGPYGKILWLSVSRGSVRGLSTARISGIARELEVDDQMNFLGIVLLYPMEAANRASSEYY